MKNRRTRLLQIRINNKRLRDKILHIMLSISDDEGSTRGKCKLMNEALWIVSDQYIQLQPIRTDKCLK